jgi:threonine dehydratase
VEKPHVIATTVPLEAIRRAQAGLAGRVHRTPLLTSRTLGELTGTRLYLKAECLQKTGSFKARGVINRLAELSAEERARGIIGISAGNHAQAMAWAATLEGVRCTVVMPASASAAKVNASRAYGAEVVLHGTVHEAFAKMEELRVAHDFVLVHPFADAAVIAGQGTVGLEIVSDLPEVDAVIVPVGGGGLIAGIAAAVNALRPEARVIGVEPEGAATLGAALEAGHVVTLPSVATVADGLAAPMTSDLALAHARALVDSVVTVTDAEIVEALRMLLQRAKLLAEPAGAAGLAALLSGTVRLPPDARIAVVVSGGNIDLQRLKELLP